MYALSLPDNRSVRHSLTWQTVRFRRAESGGGWVLLGVPSDKIEAVCARLFALGCGCLSDPFFYRIRCKQFVAVHFQAKADVAARLAGLFPSPDEVAPLALSADGSKVLSGAAASKASRWQAAG